VKKRARYLLPLLVGMFLFVAVPSALGGESTWQVVTYWGSCSAGFTVETVSGAVDHCVPYPSGVTPIATSYSPAENGSVVFMANDNTNPGSGDQGSIWLVTPDGSPVHLDSNVWDFDPSISYDGSKVVFARFDPTTWASDLYSVNANGSDLQLVVSGGGTNDLGVPSISPDGSEIAYWCTAAVHATSAGPGCGPLTDGSYRSEGVMRIGIDGSNPRMIVIGPGDNLEPGGPSALSWSPDSQWLATDGSLSVTTDLGETAQRQLFEYRTDGSDLFNNRDPSRQITHFVYDPNAVFPNAPYYEQFSPDGSELLYMDFINDDGYTGNFSYLIGADGSNRHQVFLNPAPLNCVDGSCGPPSFGEFIPTATPVAPPALVDATHESVPSVAHKTVAGATSTLTAAHLTVGNVKQVSSSTIPAGLVISQTPTAGATAHRTTKDGPPVALVVSKGNLTVATTGTGRGTVTSNPAGISCGLTCAYKFPTGASVKLVATPAIGSVFVGWSGACTGMGSCHLVMSQVRSVKAAFKRVCLVPNVLGVTLAAAKAALRQAACAVGAVTQTYSSTVKAGYVKAQNLAAGTKHTAGTKVALVVSKGPPV
jgi:hypothetical protein